MQKGQSTVRAFFDLDRQNLEEKLDPTKEIHRFLARLWCDSRALHLHTLYLCSESHMDRCLSLSQGVKGKWSSACGEGDLKFERE